MPYYNLIDACDKLQRRCTKICDTYHGGAWLFDKLCRYFDAEPAAVSITIPVTVNLVGDREATISRDGSLVIS